MMRKVLATAAFATISMALGHNAYAVSYSVDSVSLLDPNPSNLTITEVGNTSLALSRTLIAAAHLAGTGGTIDFQQQFQGGTFPNATAASNGVDFGAGPLNPLLVTASSAPGVGGLVATGPTIFSFYRLESTATGTTTGTVGNNNVDSNTNQNGNIVSGGYKSRNPGTGTNYDLTARDGTAVSGPVDFTGGIPAIDVGTVNSGGGYIGITGSGSPATLVFVNPLSYFAITAVPRGATRDTLLTLTLSDNSTVAVGGAAQVVGSSAVFFGYTAPAGLSITRAAFTNPNGQGVNRYDDLAFIVAVPEPVSFGAVVIGAAGLLRRRRVG